MWSRSTHNRSVRCRDVAGRRRTILVRPGNNGHVIVIFPPGEVAEFTADEVLHLWTVLHLAVIDAAGLRRQVTPTGATRRYRKVRGVFAVPCLDAIGRDDRAVTVSPSSNGGVSITVPAGSSAVLAPLGVGAFRGALRDAAGGYPQPTRDCRQRRRAGKPLVA